MRRRESNFIRKTAYIGAFCGIIAVLAAAFVLVGRPGFWESDAQGAENPVQGRELADDYSKDAPESARESRIVTWQALLASQDGEDVAAVDYTNPLAWEYCDQQLDEPGRQWYRD
ncbi:MAG: hypothetical protein K2H12_11860, partial [Acetatifactor sp.]|nr:hypothetical protein [Acetatifactor sp.]